MTTRLSDEQRDAIEACAGQPVRVADESTNKVYYLLNEETFVHLRGLQSEQDEESRAKLKQLIAEGIASPDVPASEVFSSLRAEAQAVVQRGA